MPFLKSYCNIVTKTGRSRDRVQARDTWPNIPAWATMFLRAGNKQGEAQDTGGGLEAGFADWFKGPGEGGHIHQDS